MFCARSHKTSTATAVGLARTLGIKGNKMPSVTFALDESGAKGYSDNREKVKGELGVVAGVLVPAEHVSRVVSEIGEITERFKTNGKLHITDLGA